MKRTLLDRYLELRPDDIVKVTEFFERTWVTSPARLELYFGKNNMRNVVNLCAMPASTLALTPTGLHKFTWSLTGMSKVNRFYPLILRDILLSKMSDLPYEYYPLSGNTHNVETIYRVDEYLEKHN